VNQTVVSFSTFRFVMNRNVKKKCFHYQWTIWIDFYQFVIPHGQSCNSWVQRVCS